MGNCICSSFETTQVTTAKVVVYDGTMQEFSDPVKVSYLLQLYPACFICDSDEMAFDDFVTAVHEDEELKLGQLYFALPLSQLKRHLPPQQMAALAVTAHSALNKNGAKCGSGRQQILVFTAGGCGDGGGVGGSVTVGVAKRGKNKIGGGRGRGKFTATLSSIPEQG